MKSGSPVSIEANIGAGMKDAAAANRLALLRKHGKMTALQADAKGDKLATILADDVPCRFKLVEMPARPSDSVGVFFDKTSGQFLFMEKGQHKLKYNYNTVYEDDVVRLDNDTTKRRFDQVSGVYLEEYLKENPEADRNAVHTTSHLQAPRFHISSPG